MSILNLSRLLVFFSTFEDFWVMYLKIILKSIKQVLNCEYDIWNSMYFLYNVIMYYRIVTWLL